jgi:hypothetical protein
MFWFFVNHHQGAYSTSKNHLYSFIASYVQVCEYSVKNKYIKSLIAYKEWRERERERERERDVDNVL